MIKPVLYVFAGANGSGKTTIAKRFTELLKISFINADEIALKITGKVNTSIISAGKEFISQIQLKLTQKKDFAIESTLSGKTLKTFIKQAKKEGFKIHIFYLFLDKPDINIERIRVRVQSGGHHIPDKDVERRFYRSIHNFWEFYRPLSDHWGIMYNSTERLVHVAYGNNHDNEVIIDKDLKQLFMEIKNAKT